VYPGEPHVPDREKEALSNLTKGEGGNDLPGMNETYPPPKKERGMLFPEKTRKYHRDAPFPVIRPT